jgi:neutral ceramidase
MPAETSLRAGVAREDITPPLGTPLIGTLRECASGAVEENLTVTALVLDSSDVTVVLLACDAVILTPEEASTIRDRVGQRLDLPPAHVVLNVSHSHATPAPPAFGEYDEVDSHEARSVEAYHRRLADGIVRAAERAARDLQPARIGWGSGQAHIAVNRREQLPDGTMVLGEDADGVTDPAVGVLRVDDLSGSPLAVVVHYACHPDVLGPKTDLVSPDFVGSARRTVESLTGATVMFLQGAAGDLDPRCGIVVGPDGVEEMHRLGTELGCEAAAVCQQINTARRRDRRLVWQSTASIVTGWLYEDVDSASAPLASVTRTVPMPLRPVPPIEEARQDVARYEQQLAALTPDPYDPDWRVTLRGLQWAREQLRVVELGGPEYVDLEIHAMRIGEIAFVGIPGELFVEIGLAIKASSPFAMTLVSGYTNGIYFYIPTAAAFAQGGYEVESYRNYRRACGPTPEWEQILVREAGDLLRTLVYAPAPVPASS